MPYAIYDYRHDIKNLLVTPQIRGRFLRMEPGEVHARHSHDLGHEIFLILEGHCDMEIEGDHAVLGPGQLCVAYAHQMHQARNTSAEPMTMYLSVTPHIEPTHTHYDQATGERLLPRYNAPTAFDQTNVLSDISTAELADQHLAAAQRFAEVAQRAAEAQIAGVAALKAVADGSPDAVGAAMDAIWEQVYASFEAINALATTWNALASRAAGRS
jgi:quercetin dioxygenase-like cupin family protein